MAAQVVATKGNLIKARKSLALAQNGFELMDRKRNILIRVLTKPDTTYYNRQICLAV